MAEHRPLSPVPSLEEIARDPAKVVSLPREAVASLYGRAATVEAALRARLLTDAPMPGIMPNAEPDEWISPEEVARRFGLDSQWLKRHRGLLRSRRVLATPSRKKSVFHARRLARLLESGRPESV